MRTIKTWPVKSFLRTTDTQNKQTYLAILKAFSRTLRITMKRIRPRGTPTHSTFPTNSYKLDFSRAVGGQARRQGLSKPPRRPTHCGVGVNAWFRGGAMPEGLPQASVTPRQMTWKISLRGGPESKNLRIEKICKVNPFKNWITSSSDGRFILEKRWFQFRSGSPHPSEASTYEAPGAAALDHCLKPPAQAREICAEGRSI